MANGVITFLKRLVAPSAPVVGKASIYVDDSGPNPEPILLDDDGQAYTFKGVYGQLFDYNQSFNPDTNATTIPHPYATVSFSGFDGDSNKIYEIELGFTYSYSTGQRNFVGELNLATNGTVSGINKQLSSELKDTGADVREWADGKIYLNGAELGTAGDIIFQYYAQADGDTASVFDGYVNIKRVK